MNIICWNCRGTGNKGFVGLIMDLMKEYDVSLIILLETHAPGNRAESIARRVGLDGLIVQEARGHAGGIWVLWQSSVWSVVEVRSTSQVVHLRVRWKRDGWWGLSAVYGSPQPVLRRKLWEDLIAMGREFLGPWALLGDFNSILYDHEKLGGSARNSWRDSARFHEVVNDCGLIDAGYQGPPFTWLKGALMERLDRMLINNEWRLRFQQAVVHHLPPLKSDHRPLLVKFQRDPQPNRFRRPFRFYAGWLSHEDFPNFLSKCWDQGSDWSDKMLTLQSSLRKWNDDVFGNIFKKKRELMRRLRGIDRSLSQRPNKYLEELHQELWLQYEDILFREEVLWFQKSRCKWLEFGDRNTRYFHGITVVRRRKSTIDSLQDVEGRWIDDQEELGRMVSGFYQQLFTDSGSFEPFCLFYCFPRLEEELVHDLSREVTNEEIRSTIGLMGNFKAPGSDGLQAIFYKSQWSIVGPAVCSLIKAIFKDPRKVKEINDTMITLVPKVEPVTSIKEMRPISLCNVTYKAVTKILSQRLRVVLDKLISPVQCSFVPNRQSRDNIIITQEVIHSMKSKKGAVGWMAIKLDLEKAYDRLKWEFVRETLVDAGLPQDFVQLVWHCISSPMMKVLWNGEAQESFQPSRGIRQGDPISPYLFVLCMERLSQLIHMAVDHDIWKPIQLNRGGPKLSHLAFADDVILFAEASMDQVESITTILDLFCKSSGQKLSVEKTRIYFSKNVHWNVRCQISESFGFARIDDLGKYLGVPLLHKKMSKATYRSIIEKADRRLSMWKAKNLSFAGRVTLTKSVLSALPSYVMQSMILPRSTCDELDKRCSNFVWGDSQEGRKTHMISWNNSCQPKRCGGLGVRTARNLNTAFMMKAGWNLYSNRSDLWVEVVRSKYKCGHREFPIVKQRSNASALWSGICSSWRKVVENSVWRLGNGLTVKFWTDNWVPTLGPLIDWTTSPLEPADLLKCVRDFVDRNGNWQLERVRDVLPSQVIDQIFLLCPPREITAEDVVAWKCTPDGVFTVKSAYDAITGPPDNSNQQLFNLVWRWGGQERIKIVLWRLLCEALLTNQQRFRRGMAPNAKCPICNFDVECSLHALRDCSTAKKVWESIIPDSVKQHFFHCDKFEWLRINLSVKNWDVTFGFAVDNIWRMRNDFIFNQKSPSADVAVRIIRHLSEEMRRIKPRNQNMGQEVISKSSLTLVRWLPPEEGFVKINCDGSLSPQFSLASCGGVIRDHWGAFIAGFSCKLGNCSILLAELWAVFYGLKLGVDRGFRLVIVETDSLTAKNLIVKGCSSQHPCYNLIANIRNLAEACVSIVWRHVFWESNQVADALAEHGSSLPVKMKLFEVAPDFISLPLLYDASSVFFQRGD